MLEVIIKSLLIGFCAAMPLGPVGLLCIQRTLNKGRTSGYSVGFGSSLGDTFFAAIAILSVTFISRFLEDNKAWILIAGGVLILVIGIFIAFTNPTAELKQPKQSHHYKRHIKNSVQGFFMTLSNPGALLVMIALVAFFRLDIKSFDSSLAYWISVLSVLAGSNVWWFILCGAISLFSNKIRLKQLIAINRISGVAIAAMGGVVFFQGIIKLLA